MGVLIACLNGDRGPRSHPAVPTTPEECARDAHACLSAGATMVHVHPRSERGEESLHPVHIQACVDAVRERTGMRVSVSTRDGIARTAGEKLSLVRSWPDPHRGGPDCASVNWHEDGATQVAEALQDKGIAVEAGIWTPHAAAAFVRTDWRRRVERVMVEVIPGHSPGSNGVAAVDRVLSALGMQVAPVLVHGEQHWSWPVLRWALPRGYGVRIGLEDTLWLESGTEAADNAALVRDALRSTPA